MTEMAQSLETPPKGPRMGHKITCVASRSLPKKETNNEAVPFSFKADTPEAVKPNVKDNECSLEVEKAERQDFTQRKINLVSASPPPKTEKKKFIKLLSPFAKKDDIEDAESVIAREVTPQDSLEQGGQEVRASLDYFDQQIKQMKEQLRGIVQDIEEEQKIIVLSQMGSRKQLKEDQNLEKEKEITQSQVKGNRRKIVLSLQYVKQRKKQQHRVREIFRYCIGCQQPVIQQNIGVHQNECYSFQQIYKMDYQQIAELLREMILQLAKRIDRIQTSLTQQDLENLKYYTGGLLRESGLILNGKEQSRHAFQLQLESVQKQNRKWLGFAQQICKLNWFITLRQTIKKQLIKT